jgi:hypothetical protein
VREGHPLSGAQLTEAQFLSAQHAVVQQEGKSHEVFEEALAAQGLARRVVLSIPHFLAIPLVIAESDLIVTVPYAIGMSFAQMAGLRILRPPIEVAPAEVKQHWHARFHHDRVNGWLRGAVAELFLDKPWEPLERAKPASARALHADRAPSRRRAAHARAAKARP